MFSLFSRRKNVTIETLRSFSEVWDFAEPRPGDILRADRGNYHHYGLYTESEDVIAFGEGVNFDFRDPTAVRITRESLENFLKGAYLEVRCLSRREKACLRPLEQRLQEAEAAVGQGGYDPFFNNCEHFVNRISFGVSYSREVETVAELAKQQNAET